MKEFILYIERYSYTARTTIGRMYFLYDGKREYFGFTLEDTVRPANIKVYGETAIPAMRYDVSLFENEHYGKTIIFHTELDGITIKIGTIKWVGCLAHNGNDYSHTMGCVLVGKTFVNTDMIKDGLKEELRKRVEEKINEGYTIHAEIVNLTQLQ
jgi:hypothetical protein